jgi:hypothetical protein
MDRAVLKYLNTKYGDLVPYETEKYPNHIFFMKDGKVIFEYNKKNRDVYMSYSYLWSFLKTFFGLENKEIQIITKKWVNEHYKLRTTITDFLLDNGGSRWDDITN